MSSDSSARALVAGRNAKRAKRVAVERPRVARAVRVKRLDMVIS
jgi:hypothetical protein